jgi:EAL domain-containing protein (putative c-di-GMP-specific phosphodiesterase class I)/AmiR/NasT family two-component response regulator
VGPAAFGRRGAALRGIGSMTDIAGLRFLVVEDQGFQRWLIANLLEAMGAKSVHPVSDGRAALEILGALDRRIDVVVSDLDMPGMDGMELIRHMAERRHRASLIVVSALSPVLINTVETMSRAYGVDLLAAIQKPLTASKLEAALALRRSPALDEARGRSVFTVSQIVEGLDRKQFEVSFQPKVAIRTGKLQGAEALARWRHPWQGLVLPEAFIATAESGGLIDALTSRVVEQAVLGCRAWHDAGLELAVSVNLSSVSLNDTSLADRMTRLVQAVSLEPRFVTFEITESAATRDLGRKLENLSRLRMKGFGLSIDDYGTGYSSMQRLSRIPFTELKIDQSFVRNLTTDAASRAMVESSLELAEKLRITATAEGVERQPEWEMLLGMGCALAQGYFIAKPMGPAQFLDWALIRDAGGNRMVQ